MNFNFSYSYDTFLHTYNDPALLRLCFVPCDQKAFLAQNPNYAQHRMSLPQYQAVFFNLPKNPILSEKAVRQALWLTINREAIINEVFLGNSDPAFGPILPGNLGYDPS